MRKIQAGAAVAAGALLTVTAPGVPAAGQGLGKCETGRLCLWEQREFTGQRHTYELSRLDTESCVPLPRGTGSVSFGNRTGHPVTVYQSRECAETAEFHTHPSGSWTPEGAYQVRAFKVWEK